MATKTDKNVADKKFRYVLGTYKICLIMSAYILHVNLDHIPTLFLKREKISDK